MTENLLLQDLIARLEGRIAFHQEREAFHSRQEELHREQRAAHAAELESLTQSLEAFRTAAASAVELASREIPAVPLAEEDLPPLDPDLGRRLTPSLLVKRILDSRPAGQSFGAAALANEINRRFGPHLRRPLTERLVSPVLRRLLATGELISVREGRPHHEALYQKKE